MTHHTTTSLSLARSALISENLTQLFLWLWRRHPARTAMVIVFMSIQSISAGSAIFLLIPLLNALGWVGESPNSLEINRMLMIFVAYVALNIVSSTFTALVTLEGVKIREDAVRYLRTELHSATLSVHWSSVGELNDTELKRVITEESGRTAQTIELLINLASASLALFTYLLVAAWISPLIGLPALVIGACLFWLFSRYRLRANQQGHHISDLRTQMNQVFIGQLGSLKAIRLSGQEAQARELFNHTVEAIGISHYQQRHAQAWLRAIMESIAALLLILLAGLLLLSNEGTIASTLVLLYLGGRIVIKATSLQQSWMQCLISLPSFYRIIDFITWLQQRSAYSQNQLSLTMIGDWHVVSFHDVSFSYGQSSSNVLNNINAQIFRGQTTALFGQSGSGKTTLTDLILGFLQPNNGKILVDHLIENPIAEQWQNCQVCYLGQNTAIIPGSIRENLCGTNVSFSEEDIQKALNVVCLDATIAALPHGLSTEIGESETVLSGGELQRLVLARAWLQAPKFLILDEATSQVDSATEDKIMSAFARQVPNRTMLIISHRIATVKCADMIYVLEQGRVMESGTFSALMTLENGLFRAFSQLQNTDHP